ncbi:MAG: glycosyltransferase [Acidimicrobiaceae bacterium]|nr:glycosyltransferase [Acidimicrobiaceae bacterium]
MRIAVISYHTSPLAQPGVGDGGGMNVYVKSLSSALARSGMDVDVYTRAISESQKPVEQVEPGFWVHNIAAGPMDHLDKEKLFDHLDEFRQAILLRMSLNKELVPDLIHANYWLSGIVGHALKHELELPLITTFHTLEMVKSNGRSAPDDGFDSDLRIGFERAIMGCSDTILVSCDAEFDQLSELYGVQPTQLEVVTPGVEKAFFAPGNKSMARRALGLPEGKKLIVSVGRIQPLKGTALAVEAATQIADSFDLEVVVVGGPSGVDGAAEFDRMKLIAADAGFSDRLRIVPPQPHETLSSFYRAADLCLISSRTESFGLVALEAAACGIPIIASKVGGLTTLIDHGRTGLLVEERTAQGFAAGAHELLSNPMRMGAMANAAVHRSARYTWSKAARDFALVARRLFERELLSCG